MYVYGKTLEEREQLRLVSNDWRRPVYLLQSVWLNYLNKNEKSSDFLYLFARNWLSVLAGASRWKWQISAVDARESIIRILIEWNLFSWYLWQIVMFNFPCVTLVLNENVFFLVFQHFTWNSLEKKRQNWLEVYPVPSFAVGSSTNIEMLLIDPI